MNEYVRLKTIHGLPYKRVELLLGEGEDEKVIFLGNYLEKEKFFFTKRTRNQILLMIEAFGFNYQFIKKFPLNKIIVLHRNIEHFVTWEYLIDNGEVLTFRNLDEQIFLPKKDFKKIKPSQKELTPFKKLLYNNI